jgi:hypothetical protein
VSGRQRKPCWRFRHRAARVAAYGRDAETVGGQCAARAGEALRPQPLTAVDPAATYGRVPYTLADFGTLVNAARLCAVTGTATQGHQRRCQERSFDDGQHRRNPLQFRSIARFYVPRTERLSLRLIPWRVRQRPFVLEHLAEITAIEPAAVGRAADEMLGLVRRARLPLVARRWCRGECLTFCGEGYCGRGSRWMLRRPDLSEKK